MLKHLIFTKKLLKVRHTLIILEEVPNDFYMDRKIVWENIVSHEIFSKTFDGLKKIFFVIFLFLSFCSLVISFQNLKLTVVHCSSECTQYNLKFTPEYCWLRNQSFERWIPR